MQAHDDDQGDEDGHGVGAGVPDADGREQGLQGVGDGRLCDDAQARGAQGHAELGGGQHARDVLQGPQGGGGSGVTGLGQRLELAAARGGDGELGADEEGVSGQEDDGDQEGERRVHRGSPSGARPPDATSGSLGRTWRRVTRRPSMASTVRDA